VIQAGNESSRDWLKRAQDSLLLAKTRVDISFSVLLHNARLAGECAIKATLIEHGINFVKIHDLTALLALLPDAKREEAEEEAAATLNVYSVEDRYPGHGDPIEDSDLADGIKAATTLIQLAESIIR
jgi:HEPN domain-containing protein